MAGWLGDDESTPGWLRTTIARCRTATHASSQASSWASISVRATRADHSGEAGTVPLAHGGRVLRTCCQATSAGIDVLCDPLMARSDAENSSETGAFTWTKQDRQGSGLVMLVSGMLRSWQPKCMHTWHASTVCLCQRRAQVCGAPGDHQPGTAHVPWGKRRLRRCYQRAAVTQRAGVRSRRYATGQGI